MGFAGIGRKSVPQIQRHIRAAAQDTVAVFFSTHAKKQMARRKVLRGEVMECLRCGLILRVPEPNATKGNLEVRMQHYVAGRTLQVVVALCDEDPDLLIVTVIV